ncbi:ATP-dependent DNA ligase [Tribonema minus]|uniref:DNA ligase n=1 Tax=Tribonema minus TaxID=303371 RepID=A0A835Z5S6_9STRA|nr:ATP-dependent DNA ligase [Tribonema minus]
MHLAAAFEALAATTKRLKKADILANCFRSLLALTPEDLLPAVFLSCNKVAENMEGVDMGVGGSQVTSAILQATGTKPEQLRRLNRSTGDLGDAAQACKANQRLLASPKPLTIRGVHDALLGLARDGGTGSEGRKVAAMAKLLRACQGPETRWLVRTLIRNIRTGATLLSVLDALAAAVAIHTLSSRSQGRVPVERIAAPRIAAAQRAVRDCYNLRPDLPLLVGALIEGGVEGAVETCTVRVGMPVRPMLAKPSTGVEDLLSTLGDGSFLVERKYDGMRAQVHVAADGQVTIYSRKLENTTAQFHDAAAAVSAAVRSPGAGLIIDAEITAVDPAQDFRLLPFQMLSTRPRKGQQQQQDVSAALASSSGTTVEPSGAPGSVAVCVVAFDLLAYNGAPCLALPLEDRRRLLAEATVAAEAGRFILATAETGEQILRFLHESIAASCEGVIAKRLGRGSEYVPGDRGSAWVKLKRDYIPGLGDTFDLVPIGGWYGQGRKAGWLSPILLACWDPDSGELQSVCRCMSGYTDAFYKEMTAFYLEGNRTLERPPSYVSTGENCPVWFNPCEVWEIRGADLTLSPVHTAALGKVPATVGGSKGNGGKGRGCALRFPRYIQTRQDKGIEDATTSNEIAEMFCKQAVRQGTS